MPAEILIVLKPLVFVILAAIPLLPLIVYFFLDRRNRLKRSVIPIRVDLPRPAGFSLQKKIEELEDTILSYSIGLFMAGIYIAYLVVEQDLYIVGFALALIYIPYFSYSCARSGREQRNYRLGQLGEQAVGACLAELTGKDCKVFHDLVIEEGKKRIWNIDHVVVCSKGVFCLETKCRRKMLGTSKGDKTRGWEVVFDGNTIEYPFGKDRFGLEQAERNAKWLEKFVRESTAETVSVLPVLVLPGWFVHRKAHGKVRVINEKELPQVIARGPDVLDQGTIQRISYQIRQKCLMTFEGS